MSPKTNGLIVLRPRQTQFLADEAPLLLASLLLLCLSLYPRFVWAEWTFLALVLLLSVLAYRWAYLRTTMFIFSEEQLVVKTGVLARSHEFTELYRVVDYRERRTMGQRMMGLKTVVLHSGDRLSPVIEIPGVPEKEDLVAIVRQRVETNKKKRGVYEITNR